jgi:hypothetical protein
MAWPLPEDWDEARVDVVVFPRREPTIAEHSPARRRPDFAVIHEQLRSSKYVTLQLLREASPTIWQSASPNCFTKTLEPSPATEVSQRRLMEQPYWSAGSYMALIDIENPFNSVNDVCQVSRLDYASLPG